MAIIYLLLFMAPQVLVFRYLWERLPDPGAPRRARWIRVLLTLVFLVFDFPWIFVARRVLFGSVWGAGAVPFLAPWLAWQLLGWIFCGLVTLYIVGKWVRRAWCAVRDVAKRKSGLHRDEPLVTHNAHAVPQESITRRRFLARATYVYAGTGIALTSYGIWNAKRLPVVTRRRLIFPDLPAAFDGFRILHVSDVHAGIYMEFDEMAEIVALANSLHPDLVVQTGDMIDISPRYIPPYTKAFRDLAAPYGVVTCLGNHDRYTGADLVIKGVRDAGQVFLRGDAHVVERGGQALALLGIDDPDNWIMDDPQTIAVDRVLRVAPPPSGAFQILLAHRPGAFDTARVRGVPLTVAGHIHGGQIAAPFLGWSAGRLITKYVAGHFESGPSQLYVSRGIGVVGVPIRLFVPPELAILELRRA
jgi:uncharacterized protein